MSLRWVGSSLRFGALVASASFSLWGASAALAVPGTGTLTLTPANQPGSPGVPFEVTAVQNIDPPVGELTTGINTGFTFDRTKLSLNSISVGSGYLDSGPNPNAISDGTVVFNSGQSIASANATGSVQFSVGWTSPGSSIGVGNFDAFRMNFTPKPGFSGVTPINLLASTSATNFGSEPSLNVTGATVTGPIVGGKNIKITGGSINLSWDGGTAQESYTLLKYNTVTTAADLIGLPGSATSYSDVTAVDNTMYCYVLAVLGPSFSLLGLSDLLCGMTGLQSGTVVPVGFAVSLNHSTNATMTWSPPVGGATSYLLQVIPLDGAPPFTVPLSGAATSATQPVTSAGSCFQLLGFRPGGFGTTNVMCGVPGIGTLAHTSGHAMTVEELLTSALPALQLPVPAAQSARAGDLP